MAKVCRQSSNLNTTECKDVVVNSVLPILHQEFVFVGGHSTVSTRQFPRAQSQKEGISPVWCGKTGLHRALTFTASQHLWDELER